MRDVDRIAVEDFGLGILQMMENADRSLAENVLDMLSGPTREITVLAGSGGNGGGGLCCARHLRNRGLQVWVVLDRDAALLSAAAANQLQIMQASGSPLVVEPPHADEAVHRSAVVVDALIGYGLRGRPRGRTAELIDLCNEHASRVVSLDVPSGLNATTGEATGSVVHAERILTLALPKTGLEGVLGDLYLADVGIPREVYGRLGLRLEVPFMQRYWVRLGVG